MFSDLQVELVQELVSGISSDWEKLTVDVEIDDVDGEAVVSPNGDSFYKKKSEQLRFNIDVVDLFEELRDKMGEADPNNQKWTICYLEVGSDGAYTFKFSYDEPPRLTKLKNS
jgi:hypothetical protein